MKLAMRAVGVAAVTVALLAIQSAAFAQPGRGGFGGGFGGGTGLELLGDENVRKELDVVDDQVTKLREVGQKIQEDIRAEMQGFDFGALRDLPEDERRAKFDELRARTQKVVEAHQKDIDQVLLPQQRERLKQIVVQSQLRRQGTSDALTRGALATELNITEEQREKLREMQQKVEEELRKETEQLRIEAREKVLSVLTPEQRAKLKALMGTPIEFSQQGFGGPGGPGGGFGGGRGGPGGRGGDRGGNDGGGRLQRSPDGD